MEQEKIKKKGGNKRPFYKRLMVLFVIFMQFLTLLTPYVAYADDEGSEEDDTEEESVLEHDKNVRNGNVYSEDNSLIVNAFEGATKYDPYVHYVTTYNALMSTMASEAKNSDYALIYKGNHGDAIKGSGSSIKSKYDVKDTNVKAVFDEVNEQEGNITSDGDEAAGEASGESPADSMTESELQKEKARLEKQIAKDITDNLMGVLSTRLNINVSEGDLERYRESMGYNIGQNGWFNDNRNLHMGSGHLGYKKVKLGIGDGNGSGEGYDIYKESLYKVVLEEVSNGTTGLKKGKASFNPKKNIGATIGRAEELYNKEYQAKKINTGGSGMYVPDRYTGDGLTQRGNTFRAAKVPNWEDANERLKYLVLAKTKDYDEGFEISNTHGIEFVRNRYLWTYKTLPVDREAIGKEIIEAYNKAIKSDTSGKLLSLIGDNQIGISDDIKLVSWTPVYPEIVLSDGKAKAKLQTAMEEVDSKASATGTEFTYSGETRSLQGMDVFLDLDNHSPVLIGSEAVLSLDTDQHGGNISKLHVGSTGGEVTSGDRNTRNYVWFKPSMGGKPKKQKEKNYGSVVENGGGTVHKGNYLLGQYTSEAGNYTGNFTSNTVGKDSTIGVDNYGNVINGDTGDVLVPYWHNHMFDGVDLNKHNFPYSPIINTYGELFEDVDNSMLSVEGLASEEDIKAFVGDGDLYQDAKKMRELLSGEQSIENSQTVLKNGYGNMNQESAMRALAAVIAASTQDAVKDWNKAMLKDAKAGRELYVSFDPIMTDKAMDDELESQRWTAASLIQRIGWIMDYGLEDTIRLTLVSSFTRTYNTTIAEAGLEYIFYTDNITSSEGWDSMAVLISTVIGVIISAYLLWVGFKAYRGEITWSKVLLKVLVLAGVLFYPMFAYGNLVEYAINKPTEWIMGNQMRLSVVLDTYFAEENTSRNVNEFYENMFGKYADSDAMQLGSYNVVFYTTTDKEGFDINKTDPQDSALSMVQSRRLERYQKGLAEYPKQNLVSVQVPLTDLYKWVWDVRYFGEGMESETYGKGSEMPKYDDVIDSGASLPLFQWLAAGGSSYFSVEGYDEELKTYDEYRIMPHKNSPLVDADMMKEEEISTYGAGVQEYISQTNVASNIVNPSDVEEALGLEVLSGSELFYNIVYNSSTEEVDKSLGALYDLSVLSSSPDMRSTDYYKPTKDDLRALVRDLSNTSRGRDYWYGENKNWSNFTRAVIDGSEGTSGAFIDEDGIERRIYESPKLTPPAEDFLGLTEIVDTYLPSRGEVNPYKRSTLEEDVSAINSELLSNYLSTYSITKRSLGEDVGGRDQGALDHAEKMVMATEAYFQLNKALGWNHFPQIYAVDSIKFDKYMALVYIPFRDYGQETMTFYEDSTVVPMSTAEYVAMNDNIWSILFFMVAIIALIVFGLFYIAILYFGLLFYSMFNFVKYYIIKSDFHNKSALGSMMILLTLSISKIGIMLVIWLASWTMNKSVAVSSMNLPFYPPTFVHSVALIGAVVLTFAFVIRPAWKGVMSDKENMGGQFFSDKAEDVGKKLTSGAFLPGRGKGVNGGSQASKFNSGNKKSGKDMRNNAGRLGNMDEKGLGKARKQAGSIGGNSLGIGGGKGYATRTKRSINKVKDTLNNQADRLRGIDRTGRKHIDPSKVKASNLVERGQLVNMGRHMNKIAQTASGLGTEVVKGAMVGQQLTNFQTGMITTMAMGSAGAAAIVAKNLASQGIKARTDGENVLFDSSGYDLEDEAVRSELFNNSVAELQDQNVLKHANVQKGKVDGSTAINYDYNKGDSRIGLALDEKTGIHPETFNQLANTNEFKELFIAPRPEELTYDRKGNIIGLPEGGLRLVNPQMAVTDVQQKMNNLYNADNSLRQENNLERREETDANGINIEGMEESYYNQHIAPLIKNEKGMYTQGSRIVYNKANMKHQLAIREVNKKVDEYNENIEEGYGNESNNLMRYVVNNGDNQGIVTETVNGDENQVLATMVHGTKGYKQNVSKYKVDQSEVGTIGDNVEAVNKLRYISQGKDKGLANTVNEFTETKRELRNLLNKEVKAMTSTDRVTYNHEMMDYLDTTQVSNQPEFKAVKSNVHAIKQQFEQQEISEEQYLELMRRENDNLTNIMDSTGKLDGFILNRYDANNPFIKRYEEQEMAKNKGKKSKGKNKAQRHVTLKDRYNESVNQLDKEVGRKNLMEMPLSVVETSASRFGEEYQLDKEGVLIQRRSVKRKQNALDGKDKDAVMSYLMNRPLEIKDVRKRKMMNR